MTDTPAKKTQKKKTRIWIVVCALILVIVLCIFLFGRHAPVKKSAGYVPYAAKIGTISNSLSFSGSLKLIDSAAYTADSDGIVRDVYVKEGGIVKKDDRILRLSSGQVVKAEFDGTVNQLPFQKDDKVKAGDLIAEIADLSHLKAIVSVDEFDVSDIYPGQECRITVTATEETYPTVLNSINHISSSQGNIASYEASAFVNVSEKVFPGMQITLTIPQQEAQDVVILKMDALYFDENNSAYVLTKDEKGDFVPVYVKTGVSNGKFVEIKSGLENGETVYAEPKNTFKNMMDFEKMMGPKNNAMPSMPANYQNRNMGGGM